MTSEEYKAANFWKTKECKEMPVSALQKLADQWCTIHLLSIKPVKMNILFSTFKKQGYDSRQVLEYVSGGQDADI